jgi:tetratricopeptide (TPR) repeat protein
LNKEQFFVLGGGLLFLLGLFIFGRTKPNAKNFPITDSTNTAPSGRLDIAGILGEAKSKLPANQVARVTALENTITRGDLKAQKISAYTELAAFWKDSARVFEPYVWYLGEKAKLENSEKSLTFAAHLYSRELRGNIDPRLKQWMANQARDLFTAALELNPQNDSSIVGLGSAYLFGAEGVNSPMEGILKIREVADRDSSNVYAQFMLGYGALVSGQFDKAIERLLKVTRLQHDHTEAVFLLAEAYEKSGDKISAIGWYEEGKKHVSNPQLVGAIDEKIKSLK